MPAQEREGSGVSALDEIRTGPPGDATLALVVRAGARVVHSFPPPEGFGTWTRGAIDAAVGSLFEAKPHLLTKALVSGVASENALEAFVARALKNHLIDEAKKTEVGKMRRRLGSVLGNDPRFVFIGQPGDSWALTEFTGYVWAGDLDDLRVAAAWVRGVYVAELNRAGPTPKNVADALRTIAAAVLDRAEGAVPAQDLARVVLERLFRREQPVAYLDEPGREQEDFVAEEPGPGFTVEIISAAQSVFAALSDKEQKLVPHLGKNADELIGVLEDTGVAETEALVAALTEKIAQAVRDDDDAEQVVLALGDLCRESA